VGTHGKSQITSVAVELGPCVCIYEVCLFMKQFSLKIVDPVGAKKQGEMPLPILSPIQSLNSLPSCVDLHDNITGFGDEFKPLFGMS